MERKVGEKYVVEVVKTGMGSDNSLMLSDGKVLSEVHFEELGLPKIGEGNERVMAEFIISNFHFCPIPVEVKCECGFRREGCVDCLLSNVHLLKLPRED